MFLMSRTLLLGLPPTGGTFAGGAIAGVSEAEPAAQIDAALDRVQHNGTYDRISFRFPSFRVN